MTDIKHHVQDGSLSENLSEKQLAVIKAIHNQVGSVQNCCAGFSKYLNDFMTPALLAANYISGIERVRLLNTSPLESWQAYLDFWQFNMELSTRGLMGSLQAMNSVVVMPPRVMPKSEQAKYGSMLSMSATSRREPLSTN